MGMIYYFAYGSNMSLEHMRKMCGWHMHFLGRAILPEYEIGLDARGYANIRRNTGNQVCGLLFTLDEQGLSILDNFEGYPEIFTRQTVKVKDEEGVEYVAEVYLEEGEENFGGVIPKKEYFSRVISAAEAQKLPEAWITKLKKLSQE